MGRYAISNPSKRGWRGRPEHSTSLLPGLPLQIQKITPENRADPYFHAWHVVVTRNIGFVSYITPGHCTDHSAYTVHMITHTNHSIVLKQLEVHIALVTPISFRRETWHSVGPKVPSSQILSFFPCKMHGIMQTMNHMKFDPPSSPQTALRGWKVCSGLGIKAPTSTRQRRLDDRSDCDPQAPNGGLG